MGGPSQTAPLLLTRMGTLDTGPLQSTDQGANAASSAAPVPWGSVSGCLVSAPKHMHHTPTWGGTQQLGCTSDCWGSATCPCVPPPSLGPAAFRAGLPVSTLAAALRSVSPPAGGAGPVIAGAGERTVTS